MKIYTARRTLFVCALLAEMSYGQASQSTLSPAETTYFAVLLERISGVGFQPVIPGFILDPGAGHRAEASLARHLRLTSQESQALHSAATTYAGVIKPLHDTELAITAGKSVLSAADLAQITQLVNTRNQAVGSIIANLMSEVRPSVAAQMLKDAEPVTAVPSTQSGGN